MIDIKAALKSSFKAIILLLIAGSGSTFGSTMPPELYRAKTVFLSCWTDSLNECKSPKAVEAIQQQLSAEGRWKVVSEPAKADLIYSLTMTLAHRHIHTEPVLSEPTSFVE